MCYCVAITDIPAKEPAAILDLLPAVIPSPAGDSLPVLADAELAAARSYAEAEKAPGTRRADMRRFATWCGARGLVALPACPEAVATFLAAEATAGTKASTIGRRLAAIRYAHRLAGHASPTTDESVRAVLRGIRRTIGAASVRKAPATAELVTAMLRHVPGTLAGKRDRALLVLGFAGVFRRSELVGLQVADLVDVPDGFRVLIRRSKTDSSANTLARLSFDRSNGVRSAHRQADNSEHQFC